MNTSLKMIAFTSLAVTVAGYTQTDPSKKLLIGGALECSSTGGETKIEESILPYLLPKKDSGDSEKNLQSQSEEEKKPLFNQPFVEKMFEECTKFLKDRPLT